MSDPLLLAQVRESERALAEGEQGSTLAELRETLRPDVAALTAW